jgi:AraC-like DNA-binding protein
MAYNLRRLFTNLDDALSQNPNLRLGTFAKDIRVGRHTVEKAVLEAVGMSFRDYRNQRLLEEARRLLIEEFNLSEKEIAFKLGYRSRDAFCRFVKINTGACPSDLRRDALSQS